jgi:ABC-2 type transport system permease protein
MTGTTKGGRLSLLSAALVVARRDFMAVLWSRSFIFFLVGPLFPLIVGALAGSVTNHVETSDAGNPRLGVIMQGPDLDAVLTAGAILAPRMNGDLPDLAVVKRLKPGESAQPARALAHENAAGHDLGAILSGTLAHPVLTGNRDRIQDWQGPVSLLTARARAQAPTPLPEVALSPTAATATQADTGHGRMMTAQAAQTLLFLLMMLLAGMVLSNLVEEKGNKIIEVLAAAIPMDAVFLGKLFAMLAISLVGIAVWGAAGGVLHLVSGQGCNSSPPPPWAGRCSCCWASPILRWATCCWAASSSPSAPWPAPCARCRRFPCP